MNIENIQEHKKLIKKMKIKTQSLTINQVTDNIDLVSNENGKHRIISKCEQGLSKSRNLAIKNAKEDVVLLADDDIVYEDNYADIINESYMKNKNADIICFYVESNNKKRPIKRIKGKRVNIINLMRITSSQITFRKSAIEGITFDEKYGAGSIINRGEENIFLRDCLKMNKKIIYINKKIATIDQTNSTWFKKFDEEYFLNQGAVFKRMYPKWYLLIILQFIVRKYPLYKKNVRVSRALRSMIIGARWK